ncbi:MAG: hypothetical protein M1836_006446 [Candelina mexicana]|nr:MAG: hypothetical protein M1836_006446 [Candelina mexicana]
MYLKLLITIFLSFLSFVFSRRTTPGQGSIGPPNKGPVCDPIIYGQPMYSDCLRAQDSWVEMISPPDFDFWHMSDSVFNNAVREYRSDDDTTHWPANAAALGHVRLPLTGSVGTCTVDLRLEPDGMPDTASWNDVVMEGLGAVEEVCLKAYKSLSEPIAGGYILIGERNNIRATFYGQHAILPKDVYPVVVHLPPAAKKQKCNVNAYAFQGDCSGDMKVPVIFSGTIMPDVLFGVLKVKPWADVAISFISATLDS